MSATGYPKPLSKKGKGGEHKFQRETRRDRYMQANSREERKGPPSEQSGGDEKNRRGISWVQEREEGTPLTNSTGL